MKDSLAMQEKTLEKPRLGLVLSGGGARGYAHVGALRALHHLGVFPDVMVGVSMGAVVGATYALNDDWYGALVDMDISGFPPLPNFSEPGVFNYVKNLRVTQKVISGMYFGWGVGQPTVEWGRKVLSNLTLNKPLEAGRIPVFATATDIVSGERVVLASGPATEALYASAALAGILPPAEIDGRILIDGGYCDLAPVDVARQAGAEVVIVVDAATNFEAKTPANGLQAMFRAIEICQNAHTYLRFKPADMVLRPVIDPPVGVLEFSSKRRCTASGARAVMGSRAEIRRLTQALEPEVASVFQSEARNFTQERNGT